MAVYTGGDASLIRLLNAAARQVPAIRADVDRAWDTLRAQGARWPEPDDPNTTVEDYFGMLTRMPIDRLRVLTLDWMAVVRPLIKED